MNPISYASRGCFTSRLSESPAFFDYHFSMAFPIRVCASCGEEFELKPGKPGFANRCPECSVQDEALGAAKSPGVKAQTDKELVAARKKAIRDLLYRKDG